MTTSSVSYTHLDVYKRQIENWGRGIQKIRDACKAHGAEEPEYIVHGGDIMVKFKALQSAIVTSKVPHVTMDVSKDVSIEDGILHLIRDNKDITTTEMAEYLAVTRRTIQRVLDCLLYTSPYLEVLL